MERRKLGVYGVFLEKVILALGHWALAIGKCKKTSFSLYFVTVGRLKYTAEKRFAYEYIQSAS
jgi:hypothetical protein